MPWSTLPRARVREHRTPRHARDAPPDTLHPDYVALDSADRLAAAMVVRGLSVRDLARQVGQVSGRPCSPSLVGHLRSGQRDTCHRTTAAAISLVLGIPGARLWRPDPDEDQAA